MINGLETEHDWRFKVVHGTEGDDSIHRLSIFFCELILLQQGLAKKMLSL